MEGKVLVGYQGIYLEEYQYRLYQKIRGARLTEEERKRLSDKIKIIRLRRAILGGRRNEANRNT